MTQHWGNVSPLQHGGGVGFNELTHSHLFDSQYHVPATYGTTPDAYYGRQQPKKRGFSLFRAVGNFFKGGVVDTIKGMFSLKGILTMAGAGALIAFTGGAALPFLAAAGIGIGSFQAIKGVVNAASLYASGDAEGAEKAFSGIGSGVITALLSFLGARSAYRGGHVKTATVADGKVVTAQQATASSKGLAGSTKGTLQQLFADVTGKSAVYKIGSKGQPLIVTKAAEGGAVKPVTLFQSAKNDFTRNVGTFTTGIRARFLEAREKGGLVEGVKHFFKPAQQQSQQYLEAAQAHARTTAKDVQNIIRPGEGVTRSAALESAKQSNPVARFLTDKAAGGQLQIAGAGLTQAGKAAADAAEEYGYYIGY